MYPLWRFTLGLLCTGVLAAAQAQSISNGFWQAQSIYQIFTDRFYDGNSANNNASGSFNATSGTGVHGGDFAGIEQKLDYIKSLGFTAIWLSPIVLNGSGEYHGYAGKNFYAVDPHWGSLAELQSLVNAAHARGLLMIQDVVVNHGGTLVRTTTGASTFNYPAGYALRYNSAGNQYAAPFQTNAAFPNLTNLFHNYGSIQDYGDPTQVELGELSGLDDFRTETAYLRTNMAAVYNYWIQTAGFDGFRVDTVKHTDLGFWQDWCPRIHAFAATNGRPNFFMFGEVYDGDDGKCGSYTGTIGGGPFKLDATLDFPLYFQVSGVFASASAATYQLENRYNNIAANYDPAAQMRLVTFLDNHDVPRFLNTAGSTADRLALALTFQLTSRGVPSVYYGTEQAFNGGGDPNNREDMFAGSFEQGPSLGDNFNMTHPLFQHIAKLNNFRRAYPALSLGAHNNRWYNGSGPGLFAYSRTLGTQEVFVVLNTAATTQALPARATIHPPGTVLVNLLATNETLTVAAGSLTPVINVPATTAKLFVAQSQWVAPDPVIIATIPTHDAINVSAGAAFVLQFSEPMDTGSVATAFSTSPATTGTYSWNPTHETLTYAPTIPWPTQTLIKIKISDLATNAMGTQKLFAGFESRFKTGSFTDGTPPTITLATPTNGSVASGLLTISGTAADNTGVQRVEVRVDAQPWQIATGTTSWSFSLNTANYLNGLRAISARATDLAGNLSTVSSVTARLVNAPGAYLQRLACGNASDITDCSGAVWLKDQAYTPGSFGYVGGGEGYLANPVSGICPSAQSLYQRERFGSFTYLFDCPIGIYETTLLEAETYWSAPGQRVFNVILEGSQVLTNFDILVAAGGQNLPLTRSFTNTVADTQMEIIFAPVVDNARVSGLQVQKIADLFSDADGIPDWWRLAWFNHATSQVGDNSRGNDDADGDGATNFAEYRAGTDPLNSNSVFRISTFARNGGTDQISWPTVSGKTYQLQYCEDFNASLTWSNVAASVNGTGSILTQSVSSSLSPARLYRVSAP